MKKSLLFILFWLSALMPFLDAQTSYRGAIAEAEAIFQEFAERNDIPGTAVAVSVDGELVWSEGYGFADLEQNVKVYPQRTKFRIGSVSKPFTAAALAKLYAAGQIDLDVPIQTYVPEFPEKRWPITLRQLAGHTAGIRHYRGDEFLSRTHYPTVKEGLSIFANDTLLFEPGTDYSYSSYGWNLVSAAIEGATGQSFLTLMQDSVFMPLQMYHTAADYTNRLVPRRSRFYVKDDNGQIIPAPFVDNSYKWAGGGFLSTVEDMVRFGQAHLDGTLVDDTIVQEWIRPQQTAGGKSTNYGIGWQSGEDEAGHAWFGHSGGSVGGITQLIIYPQQKIVVAMLTNLSPVEYDKAHQKIAQCFMDE